MTSQLCIVLTQVCRFGSFICKAIGGQLINLRV
uniref:Uncharacterized protein n=1 Tax=Anguilla anguilla TaxID=7936 RepID=A0A0E9QDT6_ANGAN